MPTCTLFFVVNLIKLHLSALKWQCCILQHTCMLLISHVQYMYLQLPFPSTPPQYLLDNRRGLIHMFKSYNIIQCTWISVYFCLLQNSKPKSSEGQITTPATENTNDKPKTPPKKSISMTSMTSSAEICRICHCEAEPDQPLISPCLCAGSLQYVHQSCLQRWIKSSDTKKCELCKYEFRMESKMKPITKVSPCVHAVE